jgi:hypothetical protein
MNELVVQIGKFKSFQKINISLCTPNGTVGLQEVAYLMQKINVSCAGWF